MLLATDLADYLVLQGVPFREAHEVIGKIVAYCAREGRHLNELKVEELQRFSKAFDKKAMQGIDVMTALGKRQGIGAPSPENVRARLKHWRKVLSQA
jgi:argininosuccinate lyase